MRHNLSGRQLSRNAPHRHALLRSLSVSLLRHETIRTTIPKAKELRRVVEPLITLGKDDSEVQSPSRVLASARHRDRRQAVRHHRPALQGAPGWLHAHPAHGAASGRQRPDGADAAGRAFGPCGRRSRAGRQEGEEGRGLQRSTRPRRKPRLKPRRAAKRPPRKRKLPRPSRRRPPRKLASLPKRKRLLRRRRNLRSNQKGDRSIFPPQTGAARRLFRFWLSPLVRVARIFTWTATCPIQH